MAKNIYRRAARATGFGRQNIGDGGTRAIREQSQTTINALKLQQQRSSEYANQSLQTLQGVHRSEEKNRQIIQKMEDDIYRNKREKIRERGQQEYNKFIGEAKQHEKDAKFWMDFAPTLGKNLGKAAENAYHMAGWALADQEIEEGNLYGYNPDMEAFHAEFANENQKTTNELAQDLEPEDAQDLRIRTHSNSWYVEQRMLAFFNQNPETFIKPFLDDIPDQITGSKDDDAVYRSYGNAVGIEIARQLGINPNSAAGQRIRSGVSLVFNDGLNTRELTRRYEKGLKLLNESSVHLDQAPFENWAAIVQGMFDTAVNLPTTDGKGGFGASPGRSAAGALVFGEYIARTIDDPSKLEQILSTCISGTGGDTGNACVSYTDKYAHVDLLGEAKRLQNQRLNTEKKVAEEENDFNVQATAQDISDNNWKSWKEDDTNTVLSWEQLVQWMDEKDVLPNNRGAVIAELKKLDNGFTFSYNADSIVSAQVQYNIQAAARSGDMNFAVTQFHLLPATERNKLAGLFQFAQFTLDQGITQKEINDSSKDLVRRLLGAKQVDTVLHESARYAITAISGEVWRELERLYRENPGVGRDQLIIDATSNVFSKVEEGKGIWEVTPAAEAEGNDAIFPYFNVGSLDELQVAQEGYTYVGDEFWTNPANEFQQQGISGAKTYDEFKGILTNNSLSLLNRREAHRLIRDINDGVLNLKVPEAFVDISERYGIPKHQVISDHLKQLGYDVYVPPTPEDQARQVTGTGYGGKVTFREITLNSLLKDLSPEQAFNFGTNTNAFNTYEGAISGLQETNPGLWEKALTNPSVLSPEALRKAYNSGWVRASIGEDGKIEFIRR